MSRPPARSLPPAALAALPLLLRQLLLVCGLSVAVARRAAKGVAPQPRVAASRPLRAALLLLAVAGAGCQSPAWSTVVSLSSLVSGVSCVASGGVTMTNFNGATCADILSASPMWNPQGYVRRRPRDRLPPGASVR